MKAKRIDFKKDKDINDAHVSREKMMIKGHEKDNYLTAIEVGVTNYCNLRCSHCGVYEHFIYTSDKEGDKEKVVALKKALEYLPTLSCLSITGGEPLLSRRTVEDVILPLLIWASDKGIVTQINTNLVVPHTTLEIVAEYVSIFHTSFNYTSEGDFARIAYGKIATKHITRTYQNLLENIDFLIKNNACISAETMLDSGTYEHFTEINHLLANLGVARQEIQTPFPNNNDLYQIPSLEELSLHLDRFIEERDENLLVQLDCTPFLPCSKNKNVIALLEKMAKAPNFVIRSCPDGRSRLNINLDGDVRVTDFADLKPIGSIRKDSLLNIYQKWRKSALYQKFNCECKEHQCLGPCILIANAYYPDWNYGKIKQ